VEEAGEHDQGRVSRLLAFNSTIDRRRALGGGRRDPMMGRSVERQCQSRGRPIGGEKCNAR
jgi:hypothetical protein